MSITRNFEIWDTAWMTRSRWDAIARQCPEDGLEDAMDSWMEEFGDRHRFSTRHHNASMEEVCAALLERALTQRTNWSRHSILRWLSAPIVIREIAPEKLRPLFQHLSDGDLRQVGTALLPPPLGAAAQRSLEEIWDKKTGQKPKSASSERYIAQRWGNTLPTGFSGAPEALLNHQYESYWLNTWHNHHDQGGELPVARLSRFLDEIENHGVDLSPEWSQLMTQWERDTEAQKVADQSEGLRGKIWQNPRSSREMIAALGRLVTLWAATRVERAIPLMKQAIVDRENSHLFYIALTQAGLTAPVLEVLINALPDHSEHRDRILTIISQHPAWGPASVAKPIQCGEADATLHAEYEAIRLLRPKAREATVRCLEDLLADPEELRQRLDTVTQEIKREQTPATREALRVRQQDLIDRIEYEKRNRTEPSMSPPQLDVSGDSVAKMARCQRLEESLVKTLAANLATSGLRSMANDTALTVDDWARFMSQHLQYSKNASHLGSLLVQWADLLHAHRRRLSDEEWESATAWMGPIAREAVKTIETAGVNPLLKAQVFRDIFPDDIWIQLWPAVVQNNWRAAKDQWDEASPAQRRLMVPGLRDALTSQDKEQRFDAIRMIGEVRDELSETDTSAKARKKRQPNKSL